MNLGAIVGGIGFGIWSETIGRKRAIIIACLLAIPVVPLWAFAATPVLLGLGAFLMQVAVQGAWGIVPVHLNELSPPAARALFPGFAYQLGNLIMSKNAVFQASIAESHGNDYGLALAIFGGAMAVVIAGLDGDRPRAPERRLHRRRPGGARIDRGKLPPPRAFVGWRIDEQCRATAGPPTGPTRPRRSPPSSRCTSRSPSSS